jgi:two-component sensor histidine kinase
MYVDLTERKKLENEVKELLEREKEARKHAEFELNRLQDMFEQAPSAISLVEGPDHCFVFANLEYQKMVDGRAVTGVPIGEAIPELADQGFIDILNRVRKTGETVQGEEVKVLLKKMGSDELEEHMFKYLYKPLTNTDGEVESIFIEVIDVTEESRAKQQIQQSLNEKTVLLQEIHHRVKNNLALISSILKLQVEEVDDYEVQKSLNDARNRIFSISKIHEVLYQDETLSRIAFADYIQELMDAIDESIKPAHTLITYTLDLDQIPLPINKAIPAGLLINELVTNAYEHAFKDRKKGTITVRLNKLGDRIQLQIKDDGIGLPDDFEASQGKSLGWTLIETLTAQLKGVLEVDSSQAGTIVGVTFPL